MALTDEQIANLNPAPKLLFDSQWNEAARAIETAACAERDARISEQDETLRFVERWANHHATKPNMTPEEALSCIQHYPAIRAITHGYADGQMPETPNPWKQLRELQSYVAELERQLAEARKDAGRYLHLLKLFGVTKLPCLLEGVVGSYVADGKQSIDTAIDNAMQKG